MKKGEVLSLVIISLIMISIPIYAAGVSEGGTDTTATENQAAESQKVNCESFNSRQGRIRCRLENKDNVLDTSQSRIPESCRTLSPLEGANRISKGQCVAFYDDSLPCYEKANIEKISCFRRIAGLGTAALSGNSDKSAMRIYVVTLLYELEERTEEKQESGQISAEQAAEIIDLIVDIKGRIMNGRSREELRPLLQNLKTKMEALNG